MVYHGRVASVGIAMIVKRLRANDWSIQVLMYPDSERSQIKDIMINNQSVLLRESEERFHIYFYTDGRVIVMSVDKASISEEDVIKSAESIKK